MTPKKYERDKKAKIKRITHSTKILVENKSYSTVSIRDIAEKADVSIGLIYKYFPNGKIDILKHLSSEHMENDFMIDQPEKIDFTDFPGYMREVLKTMVESHKKNTKLIKAFTSAALMEDKVLEDIKTINIEDYIAISTFFNKFKGIDISDNNSVKVLNEWIITIKSLIFHSSIFPTIYKDDESLLEMLVDVSLKLWEYKWI